MVVGEPMKHYSTMSLGSYPLQRIEDTATWTLELLGCLYCDVCGCTGGLFGCTDDYSGENVCSAEEMRSSTLHAATNNCLIFLKLGRSVVLLLGHLLVQRSLKSDEYWPRTIFCKLKSPGQNAKINVVQI